LSSPPFFLAEPMRGLRIQFVMAKLTHPETRRKAGLSGYARRDFTPSIRRPISRRRDPADSGFQVPAPEFHTLASLSPREFCDLALSRFASGQLPVTREAVLQWQEEIASMGYDYISLLISLFSRSG